MKVKAVTCGFNTISQYAVGTDCAELNACGHNVRPTSLAVVDEAGTISNNVAWKLHPSHQAGWGGCHSYELALNHYRQCLSKMEMADEEKDFERKKP